MFFKGSRYEKVPEATLTDASGRVIRYKTTRFIVEPLARRRPSRDRATSGSTTSRGSTSAIPSASGASATPTARCGPTTCSKRRRCCAFRRRRDDVAKQITYTLTINGAAASAAVLSAIKQIEVEDHAAMADMLRLRLAVAVKEDGSGWTLLDDDAVHAPRQPASCRVTVGSGPAIAAHQRVRDRGRHQLLERRPAAPSSSSRPWIRPC